MSVTNTLKKPLPKSGEEVEVEIKISGSSGENVRIDIDTPSGRSISEPSKAEYKSHYWTGQTKFWHERLDEALDEVEVKANTSKSNSGNHSLRTCYVKLDYYETRDIDEIVETLLRTLDTTLMEEARKKTALEKSSEAAQEQICEDLTARIQAIELD